MPNQFRELTDDEVFGTAAAPVPNAPRELSDEEVFGMAAAAQAPASQLEEGGGLGDLFRQALDINYRTIVGGVRDAVQNTSDFILDIPQQPHVQALMSLPTLVPQILSGAKTPEQAGQQVQQDSAALADMQRQAQLPEVPKPEGIIPQFTRGGVQLGTGMVAPGGALRQAAPQMVPALRGALSGAVADLTAASPTDPNLSNLVQDITGVPIATATDPKDNPFLNRFRNVVEGAGVGSAFELGLSALGRAFARSRGKAEATDLTPEEVEEFSVSPEVQEFMAANGITDARDPRVGVLEERVAARREAEAQRPGLPGEGRAEGVSTRAFKRDQDRLAAERAAIETGDMDPAAASTTGLAPRQTPDVISVDPAGTARTGAPEEQAMDIVANRNRNLPVPVEPQPQRMTPGEIARARAAMQGGNANEAAPPSRMTAPEGRAPQTPDDVQGQREAEQAFTLADRQRQRVGDDIRDTQTAGRPEGANQQDVYLDDGFPVQILDTRMVPDSNGRMTQVARVQRYDPRTGQPDPSAPEYEVPVRQLRVSRYAQEPRQAQDFAERAEGPKNPERPRMADEPVRREPDQTYRATAPDPNEQFPGATGGEPTGRSPFPEQPEGPGPWRDRPRTEEEVLRRYEEARARDEARRAAGEAPDEGPRATDSQATNTPRGQDADGRFHVDDRGFVTSSKGGPIRFADQKQAAKWILRQGNAKSPDQIFELANHPSGKGYTVRERGRTEPPGGGRADMGQGSATRPDMGQEGASRSDTGQPLALPPPRAPAGPPPFRAHRVADTAGVEPQARPAERGAPFERTVRQPQAAEPSWTLPERDQVRDWRPESQTLRWVSPDEYLDALVKRGGQTPFDQLPKDDASIANLRARMRAGEPVDPAWVEYDVKAGEIVSQEGRHRAYVAKELGIEKMPVVVYHRRGGDYVPANPADADRLFPRRSAEQPRTAQRSVEAPRPAESQPPRKPPKREPLYERPPRRQKSLMTWLKERGGLKDPGGDLRAIVGKRGASNFLINNRRGMNPDDAALQAWEAGYFRGTTRPTINDLFEAIDESLRGNPRYSEHDIDLVQKREEVLARNLEIERLADEYGINTKGMSRGDFEDALKDAMSLEARANEAMAQARAIEDAMHEAAERHRAWLEERGDAWEPENVYDPGTARTLADLEAENAALRQAEDRASFAAQGRGREGDPDAGAARGSEGEVPVDNRQGGASGNSGPDAPRVERTPEGEQYVLKGGEGSARQAQAARDQQGSGRMRTDAPQKPADEGLFDEDARNQTDMFDGEKKPPPGAKLYSGLPLDFMAEEAKRLFGWTARNAEAWRKGMADFARDHMQWRRDGKLTRVPGQSLYQAVLGDATAEVRAIANKLPTEEGRRIANEIIDEWFTESGTTRGAARTYDEAVASREVSRINDLGEILGKFLDDDKALEQIARLVRNPSQIRRGTALGDAALGVQKLLREELEYLRESGVEIGEVKSGYFPRAVDETMVRRNPDGFVAKAAEAYRRAGLSQKEAREAAESWKNHILFGDNGSIMVPPGGTIDANFIKGRVLPKETDNILSDFLVNDPRYALVHYLTRSTRRAEFTRRVNGDAAWQKQNARYIRDKGSAANARWQQQIEALERGGAGYAVPHLRNYIATMAGVKPTGLSGRGVSILSWTRTWGTLGLLEKATLTSIPESAMPGIRAGHPADLARSIGYTVADLVKRGGKSTARQREIAEDLGLVVAHGNYILSAARFAGGEVSGRLQQKILQTYFRNTGLERFTNATRVAAVGVGQTFMRRLSREMAVSPNVSKALLAELGVPKDKADAFSKWVLSHDDGLPNAAALSSAKDKAMADMYRTALIRFTDQSIMRPGPGTRPRWASHPFGATVFHLMNYTWAFQKNVLNRPFRLLKDQELTPLEKARVAAPVVGMMPVLWAIQGLVSEGRDALFGDPTRTEPRSSQEKTMLWLSRAGLTGKMDPFVNIATGVRYGRDVATSALGPVFGRAAVGAQTGIEYLTRNSERTNAAERKMAKTAYDLGAEPAVNYLLSAIPGNSITTAVARQVAGSGAVREAWTEMLAGPPENRSGGRTTGRTTGRPAVTRTTGRTEGRR